MGTKASATKTLLVSLTLVTTLVPSLTYSFISPVSAGNCFNDSGNKAAVPMSPYDVAKHIFDSADVNADGVLSKEEYNKAGLSKYGGDIGAFDLNSDDKVVLEEYIKVFEKHHSSDKSV